jgi:heme exporter protein D
MKASNNGKPDPGGRDPDSPAQIADIAIRKAGRRTWCLGIAAMLLWACVAVGSVLTVYGVYVYIWPGLFQVAHHGPKATDQDWALAARLMRFVGSLMIPMAYVWGALVILAAAATMLYVRSHHNASLVQIRAELQDISHELRRLADEGRTQAD